MEDLKSLFFVFVAWKVCSGLDLSATHRVFPAVTWVTFAARIFFYCFLNVANDSVFTNYFSQVSGLFERHYWVTFKYFSFFVCLLRRPVFFIIWETFGTDLLLSGLYDWHYCYFQFHEVGVLLVITCCSTSSFMLSAFLSLFHRFLRKFGGFIPKYSDCRAHWFKCQCLTQWNSFLYAKWVLRRAV